MANRTNLASGSPWERQIGYSRAVRIGNVIEVTGTVADDEGKLVGKNDPYAQAKFALSKIQRFIEQAGGDLKDVIRTRMYVTNIDLWEEFGRAHQEFFGDIMPATSMIEVSRFIGPEYLIEIEATAIVSE